MIRSGRFFLAALGSLTLVFASWVTVQAVSLERGSGEAAVSAPGQGEGVRSGGDLAKPVAIPWGNQAGQLGWSAPGSPGFQDQAARGPWSFRLTERGIWVTDTYHRSVCLFSSAGREILRIRGNGKEEFAFPLDLAIAPDGTIAVADGGDRQCLELFTPDGKWRQTIWASTQGRFLQISLVEISGSGQIYVGDVGAGRLITLDIQGRTVSAIPWNGEGLGVPEGNAILLARQADGRASLSRSGGAAVKFPLPWPESPMIRIRACLDDRILVSRPGLGTDLNLLDLCEIRLADGRTRKARVPSPVAQRGFAYGANGTLWSIDADPLQAPKGAWRLRRIELR